MDGPASVFTARRYASAVYMRQLILERGVRADQERGSSIFGFPAKRQTDAMTDDETDAHASSLSDRELATG